MLAPNSTSTEYRMQEGQIVESYARQLFPTITLIDHSQPFNDVVAQSNYAINRSADPICNALINANDLISETDILVPVEDELDLYEVKASTTAKPEHIPDIAFQRYVAEKRGLRICKCFLILLNNKYVRKGDINPKQLFKIGDVTDGVLEYGEVNNISAQIENALLVAHQKKCPEIEIGLQCTDDCPVRELCWKNVDKYEHAVFDLYRMPAKRAFGWHEQGITNTQDIPEDYPLNTKQKIQVKTERTGKIHVNKKGIKSFLNQLEFPLYFLDFETFASPIPVIDNSSPYQPIPFQFSLHVIEENLTKEPKHYSWIWDCEKEGDPRNELLSRLQSLLKNKGSIIAYNSQFEEMILKQAVKIFPKYQTWLNTILERFVDLLMPFRKFHIYHPAQKGSCSLKDVLPALTGKDYSSLEIQEGEQASRAFMGILAGQVKGKDKEKILANLEKYCGQDTMAMVEILRGMKDLSQK